MKSERIDPTKQAEMAADLGCVFRDGGEYAEMTMELAGYAAKTAPIDGVSFGYYHGGIDRVVAAD